MRVNRFADPSTLTPTIHAIRDGSRKIGSPVSQSVKDRNSFLRGWLLLVAVEAAVVSMVACKWGDGLGSMQVLYMTGRQPHGADASESTGQISKQWHENRILNTPH